MTHHTGFSYHEEHEGTKNGSRLSHHGEHGDTETGSCSSLRPQREVRISILRVLFGGRFWCNYMGGVSRGACSPQASTRRPPFDTLTALSNVEGQRDGER